MEAIVLKAVVRELARELPVRVQAVLQPAPHALLLALRGGRTRHLLLSADPAAPRLHLTVARPALLPSPTAFCRLARKRLEGTVLAAAACPGVERVVTLSFAAPRDAGRPGVLLVAELMGKHSNLILVDAASGTIIDALEHVEPPRSRVRTVLPGEPYTPPPVSGRADLASLDAPAFAELWRACGGSHAELLRRVVGLSPGLLLLAEARAAADPGREADPPAALHAALARIAEEVERGALRPAVYPGRDLLLPLPVPGWEGEPRQEHPSMNEAADAFYAGRLARREERRLREEQERRLRRELKRVAAAEGMRRAESGEDEEAGFLQEAGRALLVAGRELPRGATAFEVPDPGGGAPRPVALDPALGPRQNAERLFRQARKRLTRARLAREKLPRLVEQRRLLEEELALLGSLPLEALRERAPARAGAAPRGPRPQPPAAAEAGVREYRSPGGWRILVGKSGSGNDRLTGRLAAPEDWWFHARDYPGAHVVLKLDGGGDAPAEAIREAGEIAAWHSGARSEGMVEVSYTRRRHVRKVKGAPPGKVLLGESSTLRVRPRVPAGVVEAKGRG